MSTFVIYRYQFAPIKDREPSLSGNMNVDLSDEELMDKKQDIFKNRKVRLLPKFKKEKIWAFVDL